MDFRLKLKLYFPMHANTYFVDTNTLTEAIEKKNELEGDLLHHNFF